MLGKELKTRREELALTQTELAEMLDVKQNTVYRWEADKLPISKTVELAFENIENKIKQQYANTADGKHFRSKNS